ncbi:hypothetical protein CJ030_MR0G007266 [Morella rubra]|uniref:Uncharacterized protein n=1 Tax=Morella rubra TaxID=262757 RepID=A0A6A1UJL6_9ROSI|nr:hypothetical protein CJ030_MR0G007266 [Morella rubra]
MKSSRENNHLERQSKLLSGEITVGTHAISYNKKFSTTKKSCHVATVDHTTNT